jgi:hypothetical protein
MTAACSPEIQVYFALAHAGGTLTQQALVEAVRPQVQSAYRRLWQTRAGRIEQATRRLTAMGCLRARPDGQLDIIGPLKICNSRHEPHLELSLHPSGRGVISRPCA